jgi:hypothetical protein
MIIGRIPGATRVLGKSQGYLGLPIRDEIIDEGVNGPGTPAMVTAWEPTPDELDRLAKGAPVHMSASWAIVHPPIMVDVGEVP